MHNRFRIAGWQVLGLIGVGLVVALIAVPRVVGWQSVYEPLLQRLAAGDFRLHVADVRFRWLSPIVLSNVTISETHAPELLTIREIRTDRGLLGTLWGGRQIGRLTLVEPQVEIELLTDESNFTRLLEAIEGKFGGDEPAGRERPRPRPAVAVQVDVVRMSVRVNRAGEESPLMVVPSFDVSLDYRAIDGESRLRIEPTRLLNEVELTSELMRLGLEYAIPLLAKSAWFDGRISIDTGVIEIPLDEPRKMNGTVTITLHEVRRGPKEPVVIQALDLLAQLRGRSAPHELVFINGSKVDVAMADERVSHRGLQLGLPKLDPRLQFSSQGSVGMSDRSLELLVEIPVPVEHLARRDTVRKLGVPTVGLPIRGTLDEPVVDWASMRGESADLVGLIRGQLGSDAPAAAAILSGLEGVVGGEADQAIGAAVDLLRELRQSRLEKKRENASAEPDVLPDSKNPTPESRSNRPILDALRKAVRGEP